MNRWIVLSVVTAGCLAVPDSQRKQCSDNFDCETALGEICEEAVCWGGPPTGPFGVIVAPPAQRTDLAPVERAIDGLPRDGQLGALALGRPVTIRGRVEAFCVEPTLCRGDSIAATVTLSRAPLFRGGPGFKTVVAAKAGAPPGESSFTATVPPTHDGEPPYVITIVPDGSDNGVMPLATGTPSAAEQAPPQRMTVAAPTDLDVGKIALGSAGSSVLSGTLTDAMARPLINYRVVALGRLEPNGTTTEVSTVDYSTTGTFALTVADGAVGPLAIQARPFDSTQPTLHLYGLEAKSSSHTLVEPPNLGGALDMALAVEGLGADGEVKRVGGARVTVTGTYAPQLGGGLQAVVSSEATTGSDGTARLMLLSGASFASSYKLRVVPPANSELGVVYDEMFRLDRTTPVRLPRRIAMRGRVVNGDGEAVGKISVTARPSQRFLWSLDSTASDFAAHVPAASTVTTNAGDFVLWVDPYLAGAWARYDLEFEAQKSVDIASWVRADIEIPRLQQTTVSVGDVAVPGSAFLRATLTDPLNQPVAGGEIGIYLIVTDTSLCDLVLFPPADCTLPARRLATAVSDPNAVVELALPR